MTQSFTVCKGLNILSSELFKCQYKNTFKLAMLRNQWRYTLLWTCSRYHYAFLQEFFENLECSLFIRSKWAWTNNYGRCFKRNIICSCCNESVQIQYWSVSICVYTYIIIYIYHWSSGVSTIHINIYLIDIFNIIRDFSPGKKTLIIRCLKPFFSHIVALKEHPCYIKLWIYDLLNSETIINILKKVYVKYSIPYKTLYKHIKLENI